MKKHVEIRIDGALAIEKPEIVTFDALRSDYVCLGLFVFLMPYGILGDVLD